MKLGEVDADGSAFYSCSRMLNFEKKLAYKHKENIIISIYEDISLRIFLIYLFYIAEIPTIYCRTFVKETNSLGTFLCFYNFIQLLHVCRIYCTK